MPRPIVHRAFTTRSAVVASLVFVSLAAGACSDPFKVTASDENHLDTLTVFALTGTPPSLPAALNVAGRAVVRVNGAFSYDVVFDLDAQNNVLFYPVRLIGGNFAATRTVGIQRFTGAFDAATKAPTGNYKYDSLFVLKPGDGVYLQVANSDICQFDISSFQYSKLVIDSVAPSLRAIYFRTMHDPNCGFRNLTPGTPKD
jgi:hypothetical protein